MRHSIWSVIVWLVLAVLAGCGGGIDEPTAARAFVEQIATHASPGRRTLGAERVTASGTAPGPSTATAAPLPTPDETLDWAEFRFPSLFPKGPASVALVHQGVGYTVRSYRNGNFLGITAGGAVFGLGPFTGGALQGLGVIADYADWIRADANPQDALSELLVNSEEADADVRVQVLRSSRPASITTQVHPAIGAQTVYEVEGTTPGGRSFKAVLLGDEGLDPSSLTGQVRVQARLRRIQGQKVLAGRLVPRSAASGLNPIAFIAAGSDARFDGPAAGTVYQFSAAAQFNGSCDEDGLSGSYSLKQDAVELTGALTGVREPGQPPACTPGSVDQPELPIALSYTAVPTHIGTVFSFQGSLDQAESARSTALAAGSERSAPAATRRSAMPAQGLTLASTSLPASTLRATATVKGNVKQLGGTSGAELVSFDASDGRLVFNRLAGNLSGLAVDDIVSSAPRGVAPNGFLRRVTRIQNTNDGKVEVRTRKANVAELLDDADISFDQPFDSADVQRAAAMERGQLVYAASQRRAASGTRIQQEFNLVLYDQDGNTDTTDDQVRVSGNFKVQPRVVVDFRCRRAFCSDPYFLGKFVLSEDAQITVSAKLKKELRESRRIARIALPPITAGPLVFVPDIVVTVDVEGTVRVEVEVGATQILTLEAGVKYDGGFTKINHSDSDISLTGPTFQGSVEAKAGIYAALRLMLYGVAGVSAEAGPYIKFTAQYPSTPAWTMRYGIEGNLGVDIDLLIFGKEWDVELFDKVFRTDEAPNERPRFVDIGSKHVCDDGYSARGMAVAGGALPPIRLYALTDDKEDGLGSGTVDWSSSLDGPLGRTRKADRHEISATLRNGTHTITAVLTDSGNGTRTREFTVLLAGSRCQFPFGYPEVDITSNDNPFPLVVIDTDGSLTLRARTSVGATPLCGGSQVTWKSDLERRNAGTSTGVLEQVSESGLLRQVCQHTFSAVYDNLSAQTITARLSHNGMTTTDSIDVGALIPIVPSLGGIQFSAPSGTRYIYEGDQVSFSASGNDPVWSSSVAEDNLNGRTGNSVNGRFDSTGQRTIVARVANGGGGGFASRSVTINVLSALARP